MPPDSIGPYRVTRILGQGGMGVVYAAHDDRLDRPVAIKVVRPDVLADSGALTRFRREARAAARISHPHICPLYELGEHGDQPFLVMELLEGESLAARIERGAVPVPEGLEISGQMLDALAALHRSGVLHRDLKPANVFLTRHGVKLLDFGLAQPIAIGEATHEAALTGQGMMVGTPQYMSAERLFGKPADERADVWAAATVIYELFAGRPPFVGGSLPEIIHAIAYEEAPPLGSTSELLAIDRALRPALVKDPTQRIPRVDTLALALQEAVARPITRATEMPRSGSSPAIKRVTRFAAMPLRILRPDPETDFLAFSVPDAISSSLSSLESVIVRTPRSSPGSEPDLRAVGRELAVDVVLTGTLLRAGAHVRVSAQLTDTADGTLIWSDVAQAPLADLFQLQDALTTRIVSSLRLPLSARDRRALEQAPASAEAYELYMRANQLMTESSHWQDARALYERAVQLDPNYAPAWAQLGRARRVLAKWGGAAGAGLLPFAQAAFARALDLDPDSSIAIDLASYVDAELGQAPQAMERLLQRAARRPADPGIMAGLVTICRYAGLQAPSLAAHARAAANDPAVRTSVCWTHFLLGDFEGAIRTDVGNPPFAAIISKLALGRLELAALEELEAKVAPGAQRLGVGIYRHAETNRIDLAVENLTALRDAGFSDPEGWFLYSWALARKGAGPEARELLARSVESGYACFENLARRPEWDHMRGDAVFDRLLERTRELVAEARAVYERAGGPALLGPLET
jgi:serine/threonine protein kinase/tetratricopeptide (TPR) repeat protein